MTLQAEAVTAIDKLVEDAHEMASAVDDLREENPALAMIMLVSLSAYLEHIQFRISQAVQHSP
ncbi:hypothetical protein F6X56_15260 [Rhodococcus erythropolis]|uniref:hypothetical protein n=1 Tax=Rhodococcus erythropolis group TaxID=2840174 RepID=UPI001245BDCE|nr:MULTISPECIES: hypothetical protein [Rhodococcus erythropolis group]MBW4816122.1 hypothetical protein [Rhodococcus qingshengii]QEX10981.1 hypothetical protein F6X56_15260 [Rhodococcus erythropolis]